MSGNRVRKVGLAVLAVIVVLVLIQFIPVNKTNPPIVKEVNWDSQQTHDLAQRACFDCHSNETVWPWYAKIAPSSWLLYRDVVGGRDQFNFSDWHGGRVGEMAEAINGGSMPPWYYTIMHPNAKLTDAEKQQLIAGLNATFAQSGG